MAVPGLTDGAGMQAEVSWPVDIYSIAYRVFLHCCLVCTLLSIIPEIDVSSVYSCNVYSSSSHCLSWCLYPLLEMILVPTFNGVHN